MLDPTKRFSNRAENYVRYRPGYPGELIGFFQNTCGLAKSSVIADIGSGTGKLSEIFLENGNPLFGVEPNKEMREAGKRLLRHFPNFTSVTGTAIPTGTGLRRNYCLIRYRDNSAVKERAGSPCQRVIFRAECVTTGRKSGNEISGAHLRFLPSRT